MIPLKLIEEVVVLASTSSTECPNLVVSVVRTTNTTIIGLLVTTVAGPARSSRSTTHFTCVRKIVSKTSSIDKANHKPKAIDCCACLEKHQFPQDQI